MGAMAERIPNRLLNSPLNNLVVCAPYRPLTPACIRSLEERPKPIEVWHQPNPKRQAVPGAHPFSGCPLEGTCRITHRNDLRKNARRTGLKGENGGLENERFSSFWHILAQKSVKKCVRDFLWTLSRENFQVVLRNQVSDAVGNDRLRFAVRQRWHRSEGPVLASNRMHKDELLETIRSEHRRLKRYLFCFEKNSEGEFVASDRPKFGIEEMLQPGVFLDWSMKDLLSHLIDWEERLLYWIQAGFEGETLTDLPSPMLRWNSIDTGDFKIPKDFQACSIQRVLSDLKDSNRRVVAAVASIPEEALFKPGYYAWTGEASLADYVALCTYRHYTWAKRYIRLWRKTHAGKNLNKRIVLERIRTERRRLEQNLQGLSDKQIETAGVVGDWSAKDILAHLADWEQRFIGWYQAGVRGEMPETPAPGLSWGQLDILNQRIYEKHRDRTLDDVRREFHASYEQVLAVVEAIPEEDMFAVGRYAWLGDSNLTDYILANTANHYRWAKREIRSWLKSQSEL